MTEREPCPSKLKPLLVLSLMLVSNAKQFDNAVVLNFWPTAQSAAEAALYPARLSVVANALQEAGISVSFQSLNSPLLIISCDSIAASMSGDRLFNQGKPCSQKLLEWSVAAFHKASPALSPELSSQTSKPELTCPPNTKHAGWPAKLPACN